MATLSTTVLTLADWAKRLDPDGKTAKTVEILSQSNEILDDMLFKEGNLPTGEQTTIRTGLPSVYYRLMNQGVPKSKSTTAQITENAATLHARAEVDQEVAELNGNVNQFRMDENIAFVEAMSQQMAETLIYGSAANPEEFVGLSNRYNSLSDPNAQNILDAGGTSSDNSSIWLVGWGQRTIHGVFPKGSKAGMSHEDLGLGDAFDSNNDRFRAYMDHWKWANGLVVKDWRYGVRIPNIDISDLVGQTGTQALTAATSIIKLMSRAIDRLPSQSGISPSFYVNRTVASHLRLIGLEKSSSAVTVEPAINQFGESIFTLRFLGIPVRIVDRLTEAEAQVV
jgi:hypothetical protein